MPNSIKRLIFLVKKRCVFCEVGTDLLSITETNFALRIVKDTIRFSLRKSLGPI
jgi:hypothetical protein